MVLQMLVYVVPTEWQPGTQWNLDGLPYRMLKPQQGTGTRSLDILGDCAALSVVKTVGIGRTP